MPTESRVIECEKCGLEWDVVGSREDDGRWWPWNEDEMTCNECGTQFEWEDA